MDKVRIAVIGLGNMGTGHLRNIENEPKVELTAVCDIVREKADSWADKYGVKAFYSSDDLLAAKVCDAVIIATPHYAHTTIGIAAMNAGYHILVEKPISVHKADCERLIAAHDANPELIFSAMFNQRTDPYYQKIKQVVDSGELGQLQRVTWIITSWFRSEAYYASGGWRATWGGEGGGVLLNQCPHNLDLLQWICGMPEKIWARCEIGKFHNIEVEDDVTAFLEYSNGCTGVFITTTGEAPGTNRLEIAGDQGKLIYENDQITYVRNEMKTSEYSKTTKKSFGRPPVWNVTFPVKGHGRQHAGILENFADAIMTGAPLLAPAEEGIKSVVLANAMLFSSFKNETIELPLDAAAYEAKLMELIKTSTFKKEVSEGTETDFSKSFN